MKNGGQFGAEKGGQFAPESGGQFRAETGGQFERIFQRGIYSIRINVILMECEKFFAFHHLFYK